MAIGIPYDPGSIDPKVANVIDEVVVSVQTALSPTPVDVPYAASLYSSNAGTWTVQAGHQALYRYVVVGGIMFLELGLAATSTSAGMSFDLYVELPNGYTPAGPYLGTLRAVALTAGTSSIGTVFCTNGHTMRLRWDSNIGAWPSSESNGLYINAALAFAVYKS